MNISSKTFEPLHKRLICEHKIGGIISPSQPVLHNHNGYEILIFLNGNTNFYTEQDGKALDSGDILCISPYAFHCAEPIESKCYDRILLNIDHALLKECSSDTIDLSACFSLAPAGKLNILHLSESSFQSLIAYCTQLESVLATPCFAQELLAKALLTQLLVLLNSPLYQEPSANFANIMPLPVKHTFAYIEEHLTENFTIRDIADAIHHNSDYLSRCFKKITGISLQKYIIAKRIALAQEYLSKGYPPSETCYLSGFNNYSNFSRTFTQVLGLSPKKYQRMVLPS